MVEQVQVALVVKATEEDCSREGCGGLYDGWGGLYDGCMGRLSVEHQQWLHDLQACVAIWIPACMHCKNMVYIPRQIV